ncbi:hypothetical protein ABFS83_01G073100 [Erythranthe nasuta]
MAMFGTKSFFVFFVLIFALVNKEGDQMAEGREIVSPGPTLAPSGSKRTCITDLGKCGAILRNFRCQLSCANGYGPSAFAECSGEEPGAPYGYCICFYDC